MERSDRLNGTSAPIGLAGDFALARLLAKLDVDVGTVRDGDPLRELVLLLANTAEADRPGVFREALANRTDGGAISRLVLSLDPLAAPSDQGRPTSDAGRPRRFALRSAADIESMPPPEWLIQDHISVASFTVLYGPSGSMKTFEAIDIAASVAAGIQWHGHSYTRQGTVIFVAAEGAGGLGRRLHAWRQKHPHANLARLHFITVAVNLMKVEDVDELVAVLRGLGQAPSLVVFDTLARCMVGADENSSRDMGVAIDAMDRFRLEFGATVLAVHHTGKNRGEERGSSALRGAADTVIKMDGDGTTTTLTCEKQKDAEPFSNLSLRLIPVPGTGSCALDKDDNRDTGDLSLKMLETLRILSSHFLEDGASISAWLKASGQPESTFYRYRKLLTQAEYAELVGNRYVLTELGRTSLGLPGRAASPK